MKKLIFLLAMLTSLIANAYEPMIREDRVWEYSDSRYVSNQLVTSIWQYRFDGKERHNNKDYNILKAKIKDSTDDWESVALMREEVQNKQVYLYIGGKSVSITVGNNDNIRVEADDDCEVVMYDFNLRDPSKLLPFLFGQSNQERELELKQYLMSCRENKTVTANDKTWNIVVCSPPDVTYWGLPPSDGVVYVESVGNVCAGSPFCPTPMSIAARSYDVCPTAQFVRLLDPWGNVIFEPSWIGITGDYGTVDSAVNDNGTSTVYDLKGNKMDRPEPGSIYIENGEKHIAR